MRRTYRLENTTKCYSLFIGVIYNRLLEISPTAFSLVGNEEKPVVPKIIAIYEVLLSKMTIDTKLLIVRGLVSQIAPELIFVEYTNRLLIYEPTRDLTLISIDKQETQFNQFHYYFNER